MKLLFVTSEMHPLAKTGGLGDVSHALPLALHHEGLDVRVLLPGYRSVLSQLKQVEPVCTLDALAALQPQARLLSAQLPGTRLPLFVLDCPALYDRPGTPYQSPAGEDWEDNPQRFGVLCHAAAWLGGPRSTLPWHPDVVHCNDWQAGLVPALFKLQEGSGARTVTTIHNLAFQGNFDPAWVSRLELPAYSFHMHGVEFYGRLSFLKAGINYADKITTVSPRYAQEIQTPAFGCGLEGLLQHRRGDLSGILNGIDSAWNPGRDPALPARFDARHLIPGKAQNKALLQRALGLKQDPAVPLLGMVTRLTYQKGIDLLLEALPELMRLPLQLAILGSGEAEMERRLLTAGTTYPARLSVTRAFDENLSHRIIAGSDLFLMPSRFEPCGLAQMYAMAYGTPPVARSTGGLADTITDCTPETLSDKTATGFLFENPDAAALVTAVRRALETYAVKKSWRPLQRSGMTRDFSWSRAARQYLQVYRTLQGA